MSHLRRLLPLLALAAVAAGCQYTHAGPQPVAGNAGPVQTTPTPDDTSATPTATTTAGPDATQPDTTGPSEGQPTGTGASATLSPAEQFAAASRLVQAKGYQVKETAADWHAEYDLNALSGVLQASADGHYQRVFFFFRGRYLGTDTANASTAVSVVDRQDETITVRYGIFGEHDPLCCPARFATVRYHWDGTRLRPLDPIPADETR